MARSSKRSDPQSFGRLSERAFLGAATGLILALAAIVYGPSAGYQFVNWDDPILVERNPAIQSLAPGNVVAIFTPVQGQTYQPVRVLSYAFDYALWGSHPGGYHAMNALLHAVAAIALLLLTLALLAELRSAHDLDKRRLMALGVALLFLLHPVNVESVAWISSRKYNLLAIFSFLGFWAYLRNSQLLCGCSLLLAMLSSPFGVTMPVIIGLYELPRRQWRRLIAPGVAAVIATPLIAIGLFGGQAEVVQYHTKAAWSLWTMLRVFADYAINLVCPLFLNNKYPNELLTSPANPKVLLGLLLLAGCLWFVWREWRARRRAGPFCIAWFLLGLAPVSNLIPISTTMADRYLYLPAVGLFLGAILLLDRLETRRLATVLSVVLLALLIGSAMRVRVWRDSLSLWTDSLAKNANNAIASNCLGMALESAGQADSAGEHFQRAAADANYANAQLNYGTWLLKREQFDACIGPLRRAVELSPQLATGWQNIGVYHSAKGELEESLAALQEAVRRDPEMGEAHKNLGLALSKLNRLDEAIGALQRGVELGNAQAAYEMGALLWRVERAKEAGRWFKMAIDMEPTHVEAHNNYGVWNANFGDMAVAAQMFRATLQLNPQHPTAKANLDAALARLPQAE
jgi:tetratricopeptide (TPR) repeat protein